MSWKDYLKGFFKSNKFEEGKCSVDFATQLKHDIAITTNFFDSKLYSRFEDKWTNELFLTGCLGLYAGELYKTRKQYKLLTQNNLHLPRRTELIAVIPILIGFSAIFYGAHRNGMLNYRLKQENKL